MTETQKPVDIDEMFAELMESLQEVSDDGMEAELVSKASQIREIAKHCEQTLIVQRYAKMREEFEEELRAESAADQLLINSWLHMLERVVNAPTRAHMVVSVRLLMPLVAKHLPAQH
ncbi:L-serine deaminase [Pseudomonas nitritireducens]|uniref:L-serine deaminase n=1 Tax=Pseudomonas nitroreducens TaxID=46680 RepID=A0A7W7NYH2_PSENT|nr:hypothetical protein [Pseudomonas nitritireducens]MBB4861728.1 L-serine deaminase [Pseudomonas nitritireducens]